MNEKQRKNYEEADKMESSPWWWVAIALFVVVAGLKECVG